MDEAVESYDEPIEFFGLVMVFVIGALGVSSYFCITRTHPLGRKTEVQRELRILFNKLLLSLAIVFASNIALIISCHLGSWSFVEVMWVYWLESIIIGLFTAITICNLNRFDAIDINDTAGKSDEEIKRSVAGFFLMHYGGFHAAYLVTILAITKTPSWINILYILALSALFAYSHYQKYRLRLPELRARRPKLGNMFARPYLRILPMHLTIILGFGFFEAHALATLILFILLKIIVDVIIEIGGYRQVKALAMSDA